MSQHTKPQTREAGVPPGRKVITPPNAPATQDVVRLVNAPDHGWPPEGLENHNGLVPLLLIQIPNFPDFHTGYKPVSGGTKCRIDDSLLLIQIPNFPKLGNFVPPESHNT